MKKEALKHAHAEAKTDKGEHLKQGLHCLKEAMTHAKAGHAEEATKHAEEAVTHLEADKK